MPTTLTGEQILRATRSRIAFWKYEVVWPGSSLREAPKLPSKGQLSLKCGRLMEGFSAAGISPRMYRLELLALRWKLRRPELWTLELIFVSRYTQKKRDLQCRPARRIYLCSMSRRTVAN